MSKADVISLQVKLRPQLRAFIEGNFDISTDDDDHNAHLAEALIRELLLLAGRIGLVVGDSTRELEAQEEESVQAWASASVDHLTVVLKRLPLPALLHLVE